MDVVVLRRLEDLILKDVPGFRVAFKDQSRLMKVLGFLMYPFNPKFMDTFTTTLGNTVYFPTRAYYEDHVEHSFRTLAHEYVHLWDAKQSSWFNLSYAFPQVLAVLPFLGFGVLAWPHSWLLLISVIGYVIAAFVARRSLIGFWATFGFAVALTFTLSVLLTGWATLALVGGLAFLAPWPGPWRTHWELRGYTMTIAVKLWLGDTLDTKRRDHIVEHFLGSAYYFMSWTRPAIEAKVDEAIRQATAGELQENAPFARICELLYQQSILRR